MHHLRDVLRLGVGDPLICSDGQGRDYAGVITHAAPRRMTIAIERCLDLPSDALQLWLLQAVPKGERMDWIVQKTVELGVVRISPVISRQTVVRLSGSRGQAKQARWRRIAQEAAQQCGQALLPRLDAPQPFEACLPQLRDVPLVLMPTLAVATVPMNEILQPRAGARQVAVLIGPEGDFTAEEVGQAERYGARPVSLGRLRLRTETAAIATLAMVRYALG